MRDSFPRFNGFGFLHGGAPAGGGAAHRRALNRPVRRWHPELDSAVIPDPALPPARLDVAIDFVDMSAVVDRIHASFFHDRR